MIQKSETLCDVLEEDHAVLSWSTRIGFLFGHIFNDIVASAWFSYGLLFYKLSFGDLGFMFIVFAQIIDAITTVSLAFVLDSDSKFSMKKCLKKLFNRFGRLKTFYYIGTIILLLTFPYEMCDLNLMFNENNRTPLFIILFLAIFWSQIGWTMVQLSHLSLINRISCNSADRIWLSSLRQAASIYSSLMVYLLFWLTLADTDTQILSRQDITIFSNNTFWLTLIGLLHSAIFWWMVDEPSLVRKKQELQNRSKTDLIEKSKIIVDNNCDNGKSPPPQQQQQKSLRPMDSYSNLDWFKNSIFYRIAFIYMCSRLYLTLTMAYTPLYLQDTLFLPKTSIAIIPFIIYSSALAMSLFSQVIENKLGNCLHFTFGYILGLITSIWILFGSYQNASYKQWQIYIIAILLGCTATIIKIASISLVAHMIGHNINSVSFVYGTISVLEKIVSGIAIGLIEQFDNKHNKQLEKKNPSNFLMTTSAMINISNEVNQHIQQFNYYPPLLEMLNRQPDLLPNKNNNFDNDFYVNNYYQYILSYGNIIILTSLFLIVLSMFRVDLRLS